MALGSLRGLLCVVGWLAVMSCMDEDKRCPPCPLQSDCVDGVCVNRAAGGAAAQGGSSGGGANPTVDGGNDNASAGAPE